MEEILVQLGGPRRDPIGKEITDADINGVVNSKSPPTTDIEGEVAADVATGGAEDLEDVTDGAGTSPGGRSDTLRIQKHRC